MTFIYVTFLIFLIKLDFSFYAICLKYFLIFKMLFISLNVTYFYIRWINMLFLIIFFIMLN